MSSRGRVEQKLPSSRWSREDGATTSVVSRRVNRRHRTRPGKSSQVRTTDRVPSLGLPRELCPRPAGLRPCPCPGYGERSDLYVCSNSNITPSETRLVYSLHLSRWRLEASILECSCNSTRSGSLRPGSGRAEDDIDCSCCRLAVYAVMHALRASILPLESPSQIYGMTDNFSRWLPA